MTTFIETHWFKLGIIVLVGVGIWFGHAHLKAQDALERAEFEQKIAEQKTANDEKKAEADQAYQADQKQSCLAIYKQESSKWNNVDGWRYDTTGDTCYVEYKSQPKKTVAECDASYKVDGKVVPFEFMDYLLCTDGLFEKAF